MAAQVRNRAPQPLDASIAVTQASFAGLGYAFGYLAALAALVGIVAVGGLLLYLETRQRTRVAGYALARRMGLTPGAHLRSLLAELAALVGTALLLGGTLGTAAVLLGYRQLDVNVDWRPPPLLSLPVTTFAATAAAAALVAALAAGYAHRAAARARPAEIVRIEA